MTQTRPPSDFFIFDFPAREEGGPVDLVIFTAAPAIDVELLGEAVRSHLRHSQPPARVLLLGPEPAAKQIVAASSDEALIDVLPSFIRSAAPLPVHPIAFDIEGGLIDLNGALPEAVDPNFASDLLHQGLRRIFQANKGFLRAGSGYHYVNPSKRHTKGFIRTGNVLLHSAEISFVAMGLLSWWQGDLRRIFVDTASISSAAYALVELRRVFEPDLEMPSIDSFTSYSGVDSFEFVGEQALCLISASTSGGLHQKIVKGRYLTADRIVTLFYCGPTPKEDNRVLCNLTEPSDLDPEEPPESYGAKEECEMCRKGSATIGISGDQFLPADPEVTSVMLSADQAPRWLPDFLTRVRGQGIIRCHGGSTGEGGSAREIYIRLDDVVAQEEGEFPKALERQLNTAVPASLAAILHVSDPSSKALAEAVARQFAKASGRTLGPERILDASAVLAEEVELPADGGAVMVVSGAMSSARSLLGVSQYLRNVSGVDSIVYLVGIARTPDSSYARRVRSNLTYDQGPDTHPLVTVASAHLPDEHGPDQSPWEGEQRFWLGVREKLEAVGEDGSEVDQEAIDEIDRRRELIANAAAQGGGGLVDDVFLPRAKDGALSIADPVRLAVRPGFVFWQALPETIRDEGTQAEVYLTIVALLHHLRSAEPDRAALVQHEHNRSVLAPGNFGRFNDGVIQAALLRAAGAGELDFSHDAGISAEMKDFLRRVFEHMEDDEGEAAPEFLLAFARGDIVLTKADSESLIGYLDLRGDLLPLMRGLLAYLKQDLDQGSSGSPTPSGTPVGVAAK